MTVFIHRRPSAFIGGLFFLVALIRVYLRTVSIAFRA
ncbi:hypothetical protein SAJA_00405 [Salinisphaera japonica YTM-1]|uniref:Uncharacterized protein n=1 Tax=Salinisphaera japonica YTM-1 TaxID=1209778 RepID=A0A423Q324_9GAMM|nr:hypothetical protein SAJA_00405 [Salinisphaera japonica YTM-1]